MRFVAQIRLLVLVSATLLLSACDLGIGADDYEFTAAGDLPLSCTPVGMQGQGGQAMAGIMRCTTQGQARAVSRVTLNVAGVPAQGASAQFSSTAGQMQEQALQNGRATFASALAPQAGAGGQSLSFFVRVLMAGNPLSISATGAANVSVDAVTAASQTVPPGQTPPAQPQPRQPQPPAGQQAAGTLNVNLTAATSAGTAPPQTQQPTVPQQPTTPQPGLTPQQSMDQGGGCQIGSTAGWSLLPALLGLLVLRRRRNRGTRNLFRST